MYRSTCMYSTTKMAEEELGQAVDKYTLLEAIDHDDIEQVKILIKDVVDDVGTLQSALIAAVEGRNAIIAGILLDSGLCPDQGKMQRTCTHVLPAACKNLDVPLVELLLKHGAQQTYYTSDSVMNLEVAPIELTLEEFYQAVEKEMPTTDHVNILDMLLDQMLSRADPLENRTGSLALLTAVVVGRPDEAEKLLDSGVDVNAGIKFVGGTKFALGEACRQRNARFMNLLLQRHADPYVETTIPSVSFSPGCRREPIIMVEALSRSNIEMIKKMLDFDDGMTRPNHIRLVAMLAAHAVGDSTKQKRLIEICIAEDKGFVEKGLFMAFEMGYTELIKMLLSYVKDINKNLKYEDNQVYPTPTELCAPLEAAIRAKTRTDICDLLLERGADVNLISANSWFSGHSPLTVACICNHEMVPYLLSKGADPYLITAKGFTALHHAVRSGDDRQGDKAGALRALLNYGVDVNIRSNSGTTPLDEILKTVEDHTKSNYPWRRCTFGVPRTKTFLESRYLYRHDHVEFINCVCLLLREGAKESSRENSREVGGVSLLRTVIRLIEFDTSMDKETRHDLSSISQESYSNTHKPNMLELVKVAVETGSLTWREVVQVHEYIKDIDDVDYQGIQEYLKDFINSGYTLKELCRLRLRDLILPPLKVNVMSDGLEYPHQLKRYILFRDFLAVAEDMRC